MDVLFLFLGLIDLIAGGILFFEPALPVKVIAVILLTKGFVTVFKSIEH